MKKGYKHSIETRKKLSEIHTLKPNKYWLGKKRPELGKILSDKYKGRKLSEEQKRKMSNSHKGIKNHFFGKHHSKETLKKISGKNSANWKGGVEPENKKIRKSIEYRLWRESVFARDNWTCQKYGIRGVKLHPHHIQNFSQYPELRFAIDNGITLSIKAHTEFHKIYGKKNNNLEQLKEFIEKE